MRTTLAALARGAALPLAAPLVGIALVGCTTNVAPTTPSVGIGPDGATTVDDLVLQLDGEPADDDGDLVSLNVAWSVDGTRRADLDGSRSVPADITRKGQTWSVSVTANDGQQNGDTKTADISVANAAPEVELTAVPFAPQADEPIVVDADAFDADGDELTLTWSWTVDGADAGISGPVVPADRTARGQVWEVSVIASDGEAQSEAASAVVDVANRRPTAEAVVLTPSAAFEDTVLQASGIGIDPDGDAVTLTWAWYVNGVEITRGEQDTLTGDSFDRGDAVVAVAIPNDGFADGIPVSSGAVEIRNSAPTLTSATIDQTEIIESTEVTCSTDGFTDADGDAEQVRIAWEVNGTLATESATLSGAFFDRGDRIVCVATPTDGIDDGRAVRTAPIRVGNSLPVLASASIDQASPTETDTLTVTVGSVTDDDGDTVELRYAWTVDGSPAGTGMTLSGSAFNKGQDVVVTVTPFDGLEEGAPVASASVSIVNTPPVISEVSLSPTELFTDDAITASVVSSDVDGDEVTYTYAWTVDGSTVAGETSATLPSSAFAKGQEVAVSVTPNDGDDDGVAFDSAAVTVLNSAPTFDGVAVAPSTATVEDTLTCTPSGWEDADGDDENYTYSWQVNGTEVATTETLTADDFVRGDSVLCEATADDGEDEGPTLTSAAIVIDNALPTLSGVSVDDTAPLTGATLTATAGTTADADEDEVSVTFAWTIDGADAGTGATLDLTDVAKGSEIVVTATPNDGLDDGTAQTASATVGNSIPVISAASLSPSAPTATDTLTATVTASDADAGDTLTYTFAWYVDDVLVGGETGATLTGAFVGGQEVYAEVTANDGDDDSAVFTTAAVVVENSAPSLTGASLSLSTVREGDTVSCVPAGFSDADGDSPVYTYLWSNGETTASIDGSTFDKGDSLSCVVTPGDGTDTGDSVESETITVANTAPVLASVTLPTTVLAGDSVSATLGAATDADGDTVSYTYSWTVDSVEVSTDETFDGSALIGSAVLGVTVTPTDGEDAGTGVSTSVTVANTAPVIESISLSPSAPLTDDAISASATTSDVDGDTVTLSYAWTVDGVTVAGETSATLPSSAFAKGEEVEVTVTANDGTDSVSDTASVVIGNTAPTAPVVSLGSVVEDGDDLVCALSTPSTDADGDTISYTITWTVDDVAYDGSTSTTSVSGDTIAAAETAPGETWACTVVANDGDVDSDSASASVDVTYCTVELMASDNVTIDYTDESVDTSLDSYVWYSTSDSADSYAWYQFDLSSIDSGATIREATLSVYATDAAAGAPSLEVSFSDEDGWASSSIVYGDLNADTTVSNASVSAIPTDDYTDIELDVSTWSYADDLTDGEVSFGIYTTTDEGLVEFFGAAETGKEPLLTVVLESCD